MGEHGRLTGTATVYARECARRLREDPRDPDALYAQAAFHAVSGRCEKAIAILDELATVDPSYPGLWRFKARVYEELGDHARAAVCIAAAVQEEARARLRG